MVHYIFSSIGSFVEVFFCIWRCAVESCEKVYPFFIVRSSCSCLAGDLSGMYEKVPPSHSNHGHRDCHDCEDRLDEFTECLCLHLVSQCTTYIIKTDKLNLYQGPINLLDQVQSTTLACGMPHRCCCFGCFERV